MIELQKLKFSKKTTLISFLIVSLILNFIYSDNSLSFDSYIKHSFGLISPKLPMDSSIVLLLINETDLIQYGGWPIKKSVYAELIQKLVNQHVDKIAIEIIFSDTGESNAMFDSVIQNSNKIILSSLITNKDKFGNSFGRDSIIYSYPKTNYPNINSGHLNFLDEEEILIPSKIIHGNLEEYAFALSIWGGNKYRANTFIKPNLYRRYSNVHSISMSDYFNGVYLDINFKGKTIFIGRETRINTSTKLFSTNSELTGLMLHAIAYDNLNNNRTIYYQGSDLVNLFFYLMILIFILFGKSKYRTLVWPGFVFLVYSIGFILFIFFQWEFRYSNLIYIIVALGIIDYVYTRSQKLAE